MLGLSLLQLAFGTFQVTTWKWYHEIWTRLTCRNISLYHAITSMSCSIVKVRTRKASVDDECLPECRYKVENLVYLALTGCYALSCFIFGDELTNQHQGEDNAALELFS